MMGKLFFLCTAINIINVAVAVVNILSKKLFHLPSPKSAVFLQVEKTTFEK